ncbi:hypothetical protein NOR_07445 [Metarhizium rileyi]|uniref:Uncharacterized protein n=1 Tax=Metarhizium rileyi (strain RCEF 4871) TaxID=1649241 RepID=A0A166S7F2_METRR|nr:hypothetical protein NOR_07445 [Metarhizium rileyi RCEF 4871]
MRYKNRRSGRAKAVNVMPCNSDAVLRSDAGYAKQRPHAWRSVAFAFDTWSPVAARFPHEHQAAKTHRCGGGGGCIRENTTRGLRGDGAKGRSLSRVLVAVGRRSLATLVRGDAGHAEQWHSLTFFSEAAERCALLSGADVGLESRRDEAMRDDA